MVEQTAMPSPKKFMDLSVDIKTLIVSFVSAVAAIPLALPCRQTAHVLLAHAGYQAN